MCLFLGMPLYLSQSLSQLFVLDAHPTRRLNPFRNRGRESYPQALIHSHLSTGSYPQVRVFAYSLDMCKVRPIGAQGADFYKGVSYEAVRDSGASHRFNH